MSERLPFWRNPVLILVFFLPALSIVAGVGLVITAVRTGGADAVTDPVRRTAQIQTVDLGPDQAARAGRFAAVVRIDVDRAQVEVLPVSGRFARTTALQLALTHPSRAAEDLVLNLAPSDTGWRADARVPLDHDWNLRLSSPDQGWRLQGRLPRGALAARVQPALQDVPAPP